MEPHCMMVQPAQHLPWNPKTRFESRRGKRLRIDIGSPFPEICRTMSGCSSLARSSSSLPPMAVVELVSERCSKTIESDRCWSNLSRMLSWEPVSNREEPVQGIKVTFLVFMPSMFFPITWLLLGRGGGSEKCQKAYLPSDERTWLTEMIETEFG